LGASAPPANESPHATIEPSALRAAKALVGINAPAGSYTKIYSTTDAFAALRADGSIMAWGSPNNKGANAPDGSGYTEISSNEAKALWVE
jgi:hypothetical protein